MSEVINEKGTTIPKRTPPGQLPSPTTEEDRQKAEEAIINSAPLRSTETESTNVEVAEPTKPRRSKKVKPWRVGFENNSASELMQIGTKTSIVQPKELELRLSFIANEMNMSRGFGKKTFVRDLMIRALDQFTREELAKLGYDVE